MKRGRPKGRSSDSRSFGPLGDLIRSARLDKKLGLLEVANAVDCSVQFISNIEHGRAPLPWEKVGVLAQFLKLSSEDLQAANLAVRSDFKSFVKTNSPAVKGVRGRRVPTPAVLQGATAAALAMTARDAELREVISLYQVATPASRKKFIKAALKQLSLKG